MLDHIGLSVSDLDRSRAFYTDALRPLGYEVVMEFEGVAGFGAQGKPDFTGESGNTLNPGLTSGAYELQVRLQQKEEKPGSVIRFADLRHLNGEWQRVVRTGEYRCLADFDFVKMNPWQREIEPNRFGVAEEMDVDYLVTGTYSFDGRSFTARLVARTPSC